jgi:hypothetical protein
MPKGNPGRLKSRFEIRGELTPNEYEFQQHHGEMTEQEHEILPPAEGDEGETSASATPQERETARVAEIEARAHEIVERRRAKQPKSASSAAKGAKRKAAKKATGKKQSATKKISGKPGAKKSAGESAKKGSSKKSAKRR